MKTKVLILTLAFSVSTCLVSAQDGYPRPGGQRPPPGYEGGHGGPDGERGGPGGPGRQRPMNPILVALDLNHDGAIDADEIGKASESLKTLDANGDGKITRQELRPERAGGPEGSSGPGEREGQQGPRVERGAPRGPDVEPDVRGAPGGGGRGGPRGERSGSGGPDAERAGHDGERGGPGGPNGGRGGPGGPWGADGPRPMNPILLALDLNHDGTIDADEIGRASQSLKMLDKNGDRKITRDEYRPHHPGGPGGRGGPREHSADGHGPHGPRGPGGGDGNRPPRPGSE